MGLGSVMGSDLVLDSVKGLVEVMELDLGKEKGEGLAMGSDLVLATGSERVMGLDLGPDLVVEALPESFGSLLSS